MCLPSHMYLLSIKCLLLQNLYLLLSSRMSLQQCNELQHQLCLYQDITQSWFLVSSRFHILQVRFSNDGSVSHVDHEGNDFESSGELDKLHDMEICSAIIPCDTLSCTSEYKGHVAFPYVLTIFVFNLCAHKLGEKSRCLDLWGSMTE